MILGKKVDIKITDREKSGRILGEVFLMDGRNVNRELIKAGLAWWYRKISKDITLGQLEQQARANRIGLWKDSEPVPPWEFKKPLKKAEPPPPSTAMR